MHLPDFDEPFDPDLFSKKLWANVPEPIRKDVELHVLAHLPDDMLAKLRDLHARGTRVDDRGVTHRDNRDGAVPAERDRHSELVSVSEFRVALAKQYAHGVVRSGGAGCLHSAL
jgi:hypothetical protein